MATREEIIARIGDGLDAVVDATQEVGGGYISTRLRARMANLETTYPFHLTRADQAGLYLSGAQVALGSAITEVFEANDWRQEFLGAIADGILLQSDAFDPHAAVRMATTENVTLSGLQTIDGIAQNDGDRTGVKNQTAGEENGIWIAHAGDWTRAPDMDADGKLNHNSFFAVLPGGTENGGSSWICITDNPIEIGVTPTTWGIYQSPLNITAGDGLTRDVNTIAVGAGFGIQVNADDVQISPTYQGQVSIDTVGTLGAGVWQASPIAAAYGGTGMTSYTLGDLIYGGLGNTLVRLAGNTAAGRRFLRQTGTGTISAAPAWDVLEDADIPVTLVRATRAIATTGPLNGGGDLSANITIGITGLSNIGTANQMPGVNTSGTAWEYKVFAGTGNRLTVTPAAGAYTWDISPNYVGQATITTVGTIASGLWQGTPIGIQYGGTGLSTFVLGDTLYASSATTLARLAGNATTTSMFLRQVGSGSGSAAPTWAVISAADLPGAFSGFNNPTAVIGLTAVPGVATTAMRSDGAPALSQAIAPTWTAAHTWNPGTSQADVVVFDMAQPGSAGQRDSHVLVMRGTAFDTAGHNADWRTFVDVTSNGAASSLRLQSRIDAGGFTDRLVLSDAGVITVATWQGATVGPTFGGTGIAAYTLGDILYASAANTLAKLSGNTTATRNFLRQTGTGSASLAPAWDTVQDADLPATIVRTSRTIGTTAPLTGGGDLSANRTLSITGLSTIGTANQMPGTNAAANAWEYKTFGGTTNRMNVVHAAGTVTWDISASYAGQASINTVGTITAGIWRGTPVEATAGGTGLVAYSLGDLIYSNATNALARLAGNITTARLYLSQTGTGTSAAPPVWGTIPAGDLPGAFSGFSNPTTPIGLTVVNGVATTAMRSDGAPALSQAIAPVWVGLHSWNSGSTPTNAILVDMAQPVSAGQRDSHWMQMRGTAFDTSGHNADWRYWVDVTSNAGASTFHLQSRIDAATFTDRLTITDAGAMLVPQKFMVAFDSGVTAGEHFVGYFVRDVGETTTDLLLGYRADGLAVTANLIRSGNSLPLVFGTSANQTAVSLSNQGNLNLNGAVDVTGFRVNIHNGGASIDGGNSFMFHAPGSQPNLTDQEFMQVRYTAAQGGQIYVSRNGGGAFRDLTFFTNDIERVRLSAAGNLNVNSAIETTNFKLNVNGGYVSVNNSFSFTAFGVGGPSDMAAGNSEHVSLYHDGAGLGASIDVTKTGSGGLLRPFNIRMGGTAYLTVATNGNLTLPSYGSVPGCVLYTLDATGLINGTANFTYSNFGLHLGGNGATLQFGTATTDTGPFNINVLGSGSATPATKGTGFGRNLIISAGNSDNTAGKAGGDLYLRPGAPTSPATHYGDIYLADIAGNIIMPGLAGTGVRLTTSAADGTQGNGATIAGDYVFSSTVEVTSQMRVGNGFAGTAFTAALWLASNSGTSGPLIGANIASADANGVNLLFRKSRGTILTPLSVSVSDSILGINTSPYNGSGYQNGSAIGFYVESVSAGIIGCGIQLRVAVNGTGSVINLMTLGADKSARINGAAVMAAAAVSLSVTAGNMTQDVRGITRIRLTGSNGGIPTLNLTNAIDGQLIWIYNSTTTQVSILNTINNPVILDGFEVAFLQLMGGDGWMVFKATT